MAVGDRVDPYRGFNFRVELGNGGDEVAAFREVSGLNFTIDPVEYRAGNSPDLHPIKEFGMRKFQNLSLRRGITTEPTLWQWFANVSSGIADRRDGAVVLLDEVQNDVLRWKFTAGWICKWEGPSFNAMQSEIAIEAIEICHEYCGLVLV
jgi:phage tail-like protein